MIYTDRRRICIEIYGADRIILYRLDGRRDQIYTDRRRVLCTQLLISQYIQENDEEKSPLG